MYSSITVLALLAASSLANVLPLPKRDGIVTRQDANHWVSAWTSMPQLVEPDNLPPAPFVRGLFPLLPRCFTTSLHPPFFSLDYLGSVSHLAKSKLTSFSNLANSNPRNPPRQSSQIQRFARLSELPSLRRESGSSSRIRLGGVIMWFPLRVWDCRLEGRRG